MIDKCEFLEKYYIGKNSCIVKSAENFIDKLNSITQGKDIARELTEKETMVQAFFFDKETNISRAFYQRIKKHIINLGEYLGVDIAIPTIQDVMNANNTQHYFKNLDSVISFVDEVIGYELPEYNPTADSFYLKSLIILAWFGLSTEEMLKLKKSDVALGGKQCKINTHKPVHKYINIPSNLSPILSCLVNNDCYKGLPSGKKIYLNKNSEFLFSQKKNTNSVNPELALRQIIKRFNNLASRYNTNISLTTLRKNGAFVDVYNDNSNESLSTKIKNRFGCDRFQSLTLTEQFLSWKNQFYTT